MISQVRRRAHGGGGGSVPAEVASGGAVTGGWPRPGWGGQTGATGKIRFIFEDVGRLWRVIGSDFHL